MADLIDRDALEPFYESGTDPDDSYADMTYIRAEHIENAPAVNRWIPCSERLPDNAKPCAVVTEDGGLGVSRKMGRNRTEWTLFGARIIYWMPLPEPPKEGDSDA